MARDPATARTSPPGPPASRRRRALLALSPAALGAAGFFISSLGRESAARAPEAGHRSTENADETGLTDHRRAFYARARF